MAIRFHPATALSLDALTALYNRSREDYLVPMPMTAEALAAYVARYDIDLSASLLAELDGELVALGMLGIRGVRAWLTRMGVVREARRSGVGRALVDGLLDSARAAGASAAQIEVIDENAAGQRLFRAAGFEPLRRLLVLERPSAPSFALFPTPERTLGNAEARVLLEDPGIGYRPSWVEEPSSLHHARRLTGFALGAAALVFGDDGALLAPVALCGADEVTGPALLAALAHQWPGRPALKENLPDGHAQTEWFAVAGYQVAFARIEMRRAL